MIHQKGQIRGNLTNDFEKMGGLGSGRRLGSPKLIADELQHLDVRELRKQGRLKSGFMGTITWSCRGEQSGAVSFRNFGDELTLSYRYSYNDGEWQSVYQVVNILRTPCNFGGERIWWECGKCHSKVGVLYLCSKYFYCRKCSGVKYESQYVDKKERLRLASAKIKKRLGVSEEYSLNRGVYDFDKPKGMHWKMFIRLKNEANSYVREADDLWGVRINKFLNNIK